MINRELIRIKVVQLLYSSLITDSSFSIEQPAENPTREKRFAYGAYLELLAVIVRSAEQTTARGGHSPLAETRFVKALKNDERIAAILRRPSAVTLGRAGLPSAPSLETIASSVSQAIKESGLYKKYLKDGEQDMRIWESIYKYIIAEDPQWTAYVSSRENFTLHGLERVRELLEKTFANFYSSSDNLSEVGKSLSRSMLQARKLYIRLLSLPIAITERRAQELESNRTRYNPSAEDVNPNMRFAENKLVRLLQADGLLEAELEKDNSLRWLPDDFGIVSRLLKTIMQSGLYREYMEIAGETTLGQDAEFWRDVYKQLIFPNEDFLTDLEDKSVFWNGDIDIIGEFLLKTLKRYGEKGVRADGRIESQMMPMYKDSVDERFGRELLEKTLRNKDQYRSYINEAVKTSNWDSERLALMDVVIIMVALAEITGFSAIPVRVSVNEYVDIAKCYSTAKSSSFVHGILGSIISRLKEEGKLLK